MRAPGRTVAIIASLLLASCSSPASVTQATPTPTSLIATSSPTPIPTPTPDPKVADGKLATDLFYAHSVAWYQGADAGIGALLADVYPPMLAAPDYKLTHAQCVVAFFGTAAPPRNYQVNSVPDLSTLQPSPGFTLPQGSLSGKPIDGRIYALTLHQTTSSSIAAAQNSTATVHITVVDGRAYHFYSCAVN